MRGLIYAFIAIWVLGCTGAEDKMLKKVNFMLGKWKNTEAEGTFEEWNMNNEGHFTGKGYTIKQNDTTVWEVLSIKASGEDLVYIADVQQNAHPVEFKMVEQKPNKVVFYNAEHDFPKKITYVFNEPNLLYAKIEGDNHNRRITKEFFFERVD